MRMLSIRRNFTKWRYFKETEPDYAWCEVDCSEIDQARLLKLRKRMGKIVHPFFNRNGPKRHEL